MEQFDRAFVKLNNRVTKDEKKLVTAKKLTTDDVENYIQSNKPMSTDVYKVLSCRRNFKKSIFTVLFKASLLISPSTSNVQQGFSIMNLICTSLRSSLSESNLDRFIRI